jgi:4-aminobutyrate aminotransferase-like enzyme/Ser/Thr protein kinase RdoA (MazF antagonist)
MNPQGTAPRPVPGTIGTLARDLFGLEPLEIRALPGERDRNYLLRNPDPCVLKLTDAREPLGPLEAQVAALRHLDAASLPVRTPRVIGDLHTVENAWQEEGTPSRPAIVRLVEYVEGTPLAEALAAAEGPPGEVRRSLAGSVGRALAQVDRALATFEHPGADRSLIWDLRRGVEVVEARLAGIEDAGRRRLIERVLDLVRAEVRPAELRTGIIHGDANDHNLLAEAGGGPGDPEGAGPRRAPAAGPGHPPGYSPGHPPGLVLTGLIDFGDLSRSWLVAEPAIAAAYLLLDDPDPVGVAARLAAGYHAALPLEDGELQAFLPLACLRLAVSVAISGERADAARDNPYLAVSEAPAWRALERLLAPEGGPRAHAAPAAATRRIRAICEARAPDAPTPERIRELRSKHLGPNLSLSYRRPLHIVGAYMQHLWDADGRRYLDGVNNVPHVGHQHPRVVEAVTRQSALLNTNTRYLHPLIVELAERLTDTLPEPLSVCWFVNSGSEANDLALRLARAHTGRRGVVALEGGYHGHTSALIEVSPYKFDGPGGSGAPPHVRVAPLPDPWRGRHTGTGPETGPLYAAEVARAARSLEEAGSPVAAFICEPVLSCGGQIVPPEGFLEEAFRAIRAAGGVTIADEVQIGFGRLGTHMWGFQARGAVPDIVTMGKPMGNGHPVAAVVTTPEIAASFDNGMEFFSTFGGNPVSCAAALAVLDVMQEEALQEHALREGALLLKGLRELAGRHAAIGEVRGSGLFLGVELVRDRERREPAAELAADVVNVLRDEGVLLSTDGPDRNVLKIKPPLAFGRGDAELLVDALDRGLAEPLDRASGAALDRASGAGDRPRTGPLP